MSNPLGPGGIHGLRSIHERMTNPTPSDMNVAPQLQELGIQQVVIMVDRIAQMMEHFANQRSEVVVERISGDGQHGFSVVVDVKKAFKRHA